MIFLEILAAYIIADALSGIYHVLTDNGYNIKHQVKLFQYHHEHPETMTFDWQPFLAGIPVMFFGLIAFPVFFIALGIFLCLSQVAHLYTHKEPPMLIRWLQNTGLFISKKHHYGHHNDFDKNFCIFTGWNDIWLNKLVKLIKRK